MSIILYLLTGVIIKFKYHYETLEEPAKQELSISTHTSSAQTWEAETQY